eukprot:6199983-Pleurochrysis_carterae.AAC.1
MATDTRTRGPQDHDDSARAAILDASPRTRTSTRTQLARAVALRKARATDSGTRARDARQDWDTGRFRRDSSRVDAGAGAHAGPAGWPTGDAHRPTARHPSAVDEAEFSTHPTELGEDKHGQLHKCQCSPWSTPLTSPR